MSHEYRILEQMLKDGKITPQEFKRRYDEYHKELEQEMMKDFKVCVKGGPGRTPRCTECS